MSGAAPEPARLLPGDGLVAQEGGLSLVCAAPDAATGPLADALLAALEAVAGAGGDGPDLVARAARILAARRPPRPYACAAAGPAGDGGLTVLVSGDAAARVVRDGGEEIRVGGGPAGPSERTVGGPVSILELTLGGAGLAEPRLRLGSGVVRGGGLRRSLRRPAPAGRDEQAARVPRLVPQERLKTMLDAGALALPPAPGPAAAPSPRAQAAAPEPRERVSLIRRHPKRRPSGPEVLGVNCKNEHFNDPRAHYCAVCGISMLQLTLSPFHGPRPPLGMLIVDDGQTVPLDDDQLIGRRPEGAPEVAQGRAHPLRLTDHEESVSRRHALVRLREWQVDVVDLGSANGTALKRPGEADFQRLAPDTPVELPPGASVRIGRTRVFRFESNRKI
ncbi:FHA domain-containing protein [Actinomadura darangshiensis]|uniref:FHA domain-containing protein n=1 Tax=Actinomadura darangshiensis TaxID=705336 RepID=A0A4R5A4U5_9ACTN|nr:FHA domain-containing protein [Actinomadura darangshiensis]TDD66555.1 FHA domain-containing protein [Actinomadura darangshiensis]